MKKVFLLFTLLVFTLTGFAQNKFVLKGHLSDCVSDSIIIKVTDEYFTKSVLSDTVVMKNGTFEYTVKGDKIRYLAIYEKNQKLSGYVINMIVCPGNTVNLSGTFRHNVIKGTGFYADMDTYNEQLKPYTERLKRLNKDFYEKCKAGAREDSLMKAYRPQYEQLNKEKIEITKNFIKMHPSSQYSGYLLPGVPAGERSKYKKIVTPAVLNGPSSISLALVEKKEARERQLDEAARKRQPGTVAPDFTLGDVNGKPFKMSSLKGRIVVLDFWGSWCGWCIKGIPDMKKYYDKYKSKGLEILGIDCNDTEAKWKEALAKYDAPWIHVRNDNKHDVSDLYGVHGFPTKIIIGRDGKIIKTVVGETPEFYSALDEIFK